MQMRNRQVYFIKRFLTDMCEMHTLNIICLQVKVGVVLTMNKSLYLEAEMARTPSSMSMELVRGSFLLKRLRRSSYAGQSRTRNGKAVQKPSLKKYQKMKDIQSKDKYRFIYEVKAKLDVFTNIYLTISVFLLSDFVLQRFPYFSQSSFSHAVNACVGKNIDKKPAKQVRFIFLL